jgi:RHS repeat-associated protein
VSYPNGQSTNLDYYPVSGSGRLKDITNIGGGSTAGQTLSKFSYDYAAQGDITSWTKQMGNDPSASVTNVFGYDQDSQLSAVTQTATGVPTKATTFTYDDSGNRTQEQLTVGSNQAGSFTNTFDTNALNQLTDVHSSPVSVQGSTSQPASITVNGQGVTEDTNNNYQTTVPASSGSSTPLTVTQVGQDGQANVIEDQVLTKAPFTYDANGNLLKDDLKTYSWDAANRLIEVQWINAQPATMADNISFTYDGLGRRASITEKHGTTVLTAKTFVWCGAQLCQERDVTGQTVNRQFFSQGEMIGSTKYFYTRDHLGSIREMTDSSGTVQARYDYDAYGRQTKLTENVPSDFGYTGFYTQAASGLDLTWYRAYDPEKGRWLSRDPMGEGIGPNLYNYAKNRAINLIDSLGLDDTPTYDSLIQQTWQEVQQIAYNTVMTVETEAAKVDAFALSWLGLGPAVAAVEATPSFATGLALGTCEFGIVSSGAGVAGNEFNPALNLGNDLLGAVLSYGNPDALELSALGATFDISAALTP